jgi:hypothetical protein
MSEFEGEFIFTPTQPDRVELLEPDAGATNQVRVQVEGSLEALATFIIDASTRMDFERYGVTDEEQRQSARMRRQDNLEMALEEGTLLKSLRDEGLTWGDLRVYGRKSKDNDHTYILKFQNNGGDKLVKAEWLPGMSENAT